MTYYVYDMNDELIMKTNDEEKAEYESAIWEGYYTTEPVMEKRWFTGCDVYDY